MVIKKTRDYLKIDLLFFSIEIDRHINKISVIRILRIKVYCLNKLKLGNDDSDKEVCEEIICKSKEKIFRKNYISLIGAPTGEIYCFSNLYTKFIKKYSLNDSVLVVNKENKKRLINFLLPNVETVQIDCDRLVNKTLYFFKDEIGLYNIFPLSHYLTQDKRLSTGKSHYFKEICKTLKVTTKDFLIPKVSDPVKFKIDKYIKMKKIKPENLYIFCPEAGTCQLIDTGFWNELYYRIKLYGGGYLSIAKTKK